MVKQKQDKAEGKGNGGRNERIEMYKGEGVKR